MFLSLSPQIRVSTMLLLLTREMLPRELRWHSNLYSPLIVKVGLLVQRMKQADRQTVWQYELLNAWFDGKVSKIQTFNIAMLFVCPCVSVCSI